MSLLAHLCFLVNNSLPHVCFNTTYFLLFYVRKTARNFNQPMCKAAKTTIVEVCISHITITRLPWCLPGTSAGLAITNSKSIDFSFAFIGFHVLCTLQISRNLAIVLPTAGNVPLGKNVNNMKILSLENTSPHILT